MRLDRDRNERMSIIPVFNEIQFEGYHGLQNGIPLVGSSSRMIACRRNSNWTASIHKLDGQLEEQEYWEFAEEFFSKWLN